jgi:hypothetical protein
MAHIEKIFSERDANQVLQSSYNDVDATISTNGFLVGKVGNQITLAISTTTIANDTETYSFFDGAVALYQIRIIYTDGTRAQMVSATRIS